VKKPDPDAREREAWPAVEAADAALARQLPTVVRGLERALEQRGHRGAADLDLHPAPRLGLSRPGSQHRYIGGGQHEQLAGDTPLCPEQEE
jgi:hypothetical protein